MKKVLIVTLYGNYNYGNKLQNYAVQELYHQIGYETDTLVYKTDNLKSTIKKIIKKIFFIKTVADKREINFKKFDKLISKVNIKKIKIGNYKIISMGSDQIWNSNDIMSNFYVDYVNNIKNVKKISLSASIASSDILPEKYDMYMNHIDSMSAISVREEKGKEIILKLNETKNPIVLLDPTMLIDTNIWDRLIKKPDRIQEGDKFILNYFLGSLSDDRKKEINKIAVMNNCKIINLLDSSDPFYLYGPEEFLWLEKNAYLICTDSFHSAVFAILYDKPFVVFNREDGQSGISKTNSRLETLLNKFDHSNNYYHGDIVSCINNRNSDNVQRILKEERKKALDYLLNAIEKER